MLSAHLRIEKEMGEKEEKKNSTNQEYINGTKVKWNENRLCVYFWIVGFCAEPSTTANERL